MYGPMRFPQKNSALGPDFCRFDVHLVRVESTSPNAMFLARRSDFRRAVSSDLYAETTISPSRCGIRRNTVTRSLPSLANAGVSERYVALFQIDWSDSFECEQQVCDVIGSRVFGRPGVHVFGCGGVAAAAERSMTTLIRKARRQISVEICPQAGRYKLPLYPSRYRYLLVEVPLSANRGAQLAPRFGGSRQSPRRANALVRCLFFGRADGRARGCSFLWQTDSQFVSRFL